MRWVARGKPQEWVDSGSPVPRAEANLLTTASLLLLPALGVNASGPWSTADSVAVLDSGCTVDAWLDKRAFDPATVREPSVQRLYGMNGQWEDVEFEGTVEVDVETHGGGTEKFLWIGH